MAREHSGRRAALVRLCLCVDDAGLHEGINEAALRLADLQRVHAIGCLVGGAAWGDGWPASIRRLDAQGVDIGLHLDFTESPLLPRSRRPLPWLIAESLLGRLGASNHRAEIRAEIRAQLDRLEQLLGRAPAFVDGHQHVHQLPVVRHELLAELDSRYRTQRPWLRSTGVAAAARGSTSGRWSTVLKARTIEWLGSRELDSSARHMGFVQNHRLLGVYDFAGGAARYRDLLAEWLAAAQDGDLLMCHPGLHSQGGDPIGAAREAEYGVLVSTDFGLLLRDTGTVLQPMSRILERRS